MGKLHKWVKKHSPGAWLERKVLGESTFDSLHPMGTQAETAYDAAEASKKALKTAETEKDPVIPIADEEELERVRRRRNAKRGGGRASTVMSDDERLGG